LQYGDSEGPEFTAAIRHGLETASLPGRFQRYSRRSSGCGEADVAQQLKQPFGLG
jgi:hypothetical protein